MRALKEPNDNNELRRLVVKHIRQETSVGKLRIIKEALRDPEDESNSINLHFVVSPLL
jgi:hypothetical protein